MRVYLTGLLLGFSAAGAALPTDVTFTNYFGTGVTFNRPLFFAEVPGKDSNYVVLEQQRGLVDVVHRRNGSWVKDTLLKISVVSNDNSLGVLGFAFHPNFAVNRKYYLFYSPAAAANVLEERQVDTSFIKDAGVAARQLLSFPHASTTNDGGNLAFGTDGYLYVGIGDGGDPAATRPTARRTPTPCWGKFCASTSTPPPATSPTASPRTTPSSTARTTARRFWGLGLRSPWRWSFDPLTHNLWVADVGN